MKKLFLLVLSLSVICIYYSGVWSKDSQDTYNEDQWPRNIHSEKYNFKMYQPQVDSWDGFTLQAHAAVAVVKDAAEKNLSYGVMNFKVNTITDKGTRFVSFDNWKIESVSFPAEPELKQAYLEAVSAAVPQVKTMSLDRLEADLDTLPDQPKAQPGELNNTAPKIIFSYTPAILVYIDGQPVFSPVKGTNLSRVVNTGVLLLKDQQGSYYLHVFDGYMKAGDINGPWQAAGSKVPDDVTKAQKTLNDSMSVDLIEGETDPDTKSKPSLSKGKAPAIYVALTPAELIVTDGEPNYQPITGTNLLYASNTTANIFKDLSDQKTYILISGRWFSSASYEGPWKYVSADSLPQDFANIPDASVKENVKASVTGTKQAKEALVANSIPTTSKLERKTASIKITIDGEPRLKPIDGTPLSYVFNCSVPLIKVKENSWYAVYDGAWFTAALPNGPWALADSVPEVIYSIPVKSPLHYVTYVKIYSSAPDYVYEGYTPGYYGTVVSPDGTVVYGTGYVYSGYIGGDVWYCPVVPYGYGAGLCWTPWCGWSFTFGFGWGYPNYWYYPPFPFWGPFHAWRFDFHDHFYTRHLSTAGRFGAWNRGAGAADRWMTHGRAYNSTSGAIAVGHSRVIKNVYGAGNTRNGGRAANAVTHIYGTREGNVYRYENGAKGGNWRNLNNARGAAPASLNKARGARTMGNTRSRSFQTTRGSFFSSGRSSGRSGGGFGGGRSGGFSGGRGGGGRR
jgi:uncharacterized membrane protein YgcG